MAIEQPCCQIARTNRADSRQVQTSSQSCCGTSGVSRLCPPIKSLLIQVYISVSVPASDQETQGHTGLIRLTSANNNNWARSGGEIDPTRSNRGGEFDSVHPRKGPTKRLSRSCKAVAVYFEMAAEQISDSRVGSDRHAPTSAKQTTHTYLDLRLGAKFIL